MEDLQILQAIEAEENRQDIEAAREAVKRIAKEGTIRWEDVKDEITGI